MVAQTYYRKIIRICAEDSPNVRLALKEIENGKEPSGRVLVPGVLTYEEYRKRRALWDKQMQTVSLDGMWYEGEEIKLFPQEWLEHSWGLWKKEYTTATAMGIDPAEGGDNTSWCVVRPGKLIELISEKTPDTSVIIPKTIEKLQRFNIKPENCHFDRGGGGLEHADQMRKQGYRVKTVFFGESANKEKSIRHQYESRMDKLKEYETRFTYKNRRAELYHKASQKVNPAYGGFALPPPSEGPQYAELYRQLKVMPKLTDQEGRFYLPPKRPRPNSKEQSLEEMLGCSPDEADAFVLACWGLDTHERKVRI